MNRAKVISAMLICFFVYLPFANAETLTDRASSKIPPAGSGGYTRLIYDPNLDSDNYSLQPNSQHQTFKSVLPVCSGDFTTECIESLEYRNKGEANWRPGRLLPSKNPSMNGIIAVTYTSDGSTQSYGPVSREVTMGRPYGNMSSSWELPEATHAGGNEYLLSVSVSNFPRGYVTDAYDFSIALKAVQWKTPPAFGLFDKTANSTTQFNLPQNYEYQIKIRLGFLEKRIINWYNGRISEPSIELNNGLLTISGAPSFYPIAGTNYFKCSEILGAKKTALTGAFGPSTLSGPMCSDSSGSAYIVAPQDEWAFKAFDLWDSEIKEYGKNSAWAIFASSNLGVCSTSQIAGVVSSNALLYSVNPPNFDPVNRTLSYRIASTHLNSKGDLNQGKFNLAINKEVAECLWGVKAENLSEARVDVTYSDGKPIVGTTTLQVKADWVYINIENFTFSSPTFNIKATEKAKPTPNELALPTPMPSPSSQPVKSMNKSTITCVKDKITRKITAVNPKCPKGFKKK